MLSVVASPEDYGGVLTVLSQSTWAEDLMCPVLDGIEARYLIKSHHEDA